jgi:aldose 1-epimerase
MQISIEKRQFGATSNGRSVFSYIADNGQIAVEVMEYGVTIRSLWVNKGGARTDVVLGYDTLKEYEENDGYLGACVGRVGNRIGGAEFKLNGKRYTLAKNDGENHLHGGIRGFDKRIWNAKILPDGIRFERISPDGEEGYPGTLSAAVSYRINGSTLTIEYEATSDADTLCSMTNHSYFNLNGFGSVLGHTLMINADEFLENSSATLPTGKRLQVEGTPFDFRAAKPVGQDIASDSIQLKNCGGYDHNFCLLEEPAAVLCGDKSGITMSVRTTLPGLQLYTANVLTERRGKNGAVYSPRCALCLETQYYPNAMACIGFEKPILKKGELWNHRTTLTFS